MRRSKAGPIAVPTMIVRRRRREERTARRAAPSRRTRRSRSRRRSADFPPGCRGRELSPSARCRSPFRTARAPRRRGIRPRRSPGSATARGTQRSGTPIAPATSRRGSTVSPASAQPVAPTAAAPTSARSRSAPATPAREEDEAVRRWDEERQIVQPVGVDAPDERPCDLADRREDDHAECLDATLCMKWNEQSREHDPGQCAEGQLPATADLGVRGEQGREVGPIAAARTSRRNWTSCQDGIGAARGARGRHAGRGRRSPRRPRPTRPRAAPP